jgi:hypothetical protein
MNDTTLKDKSARKESKKILFEIIGAISSCIAICAFITGLQSIKDIGSALVFSKPSPTATATSTPSPTATLEPTPTSTPNPNSVVQIKINDVIFPCSDSCAGMHMEVSINGGKTVRVDYPNSFSLSLPKGRYSWYIKLQIDYQDEPSTISEATGVISIQQDTLYWLEKGYVGFIFLTESLVLRPDYGQ